jgi:hypothetical protein
MRSHACSGILLSLLLTATTVCSFTINSVSLSGTQLTVTDSKRPTLVRRPDERLRSVNQKIAALAASKPCHDVHGIFALSGQLAR